ncbi:hypothetical protein OAF73_01790, partial [Planctomycetota bacterium]|nr:hypothetical protein [Planctomycetota bacterium]
WAGMVMAETMRSIPLVGNVVMPRRRAGGFPTGVGHWKLLHRGPSGRLRLGAISLPKSQRRAGADPTWAGRNQPPEVTSPVKGRSSH